MSKTKQLFLLLLLFRFTLILIICLIEYKEFNVECKYISTYIRSLSDDADLVLLIWKIARKADIMVV